MSPSCPSLKREDTRKVVLPIFRVSVQNGILAGAAFSVFMIFSITAPFGFKVLSGTSGHVGPKWDYGVQLRKMLYNSDYKLNAHDLYSKKGIYEI